MRRVHLDYRVDGTEGLIMGADGGGEAGESGDRVIHSHRKRSPRKGSRPHCEDDQPVLPPGYAHAERVIPRSSVAPGDANTENQNDDELRNECRPNASNQQLLN